MGPSVMLLVFGLLRASYAVYTALFSINGNLYRLHEKGNIKGHHGDLVHRAVAITFSIRPSDLVIFARSQVNMVPRLHHEMDLIAWIKPK